MKIFSYLQYLLPQHLLSELAGKLADAKTPWLKDFLIKQFMRTYHINLSETLIKNPAEFASFNDFFIRRLKPDARPIDHSSTREIISPADGTIAQIGMIKQNQLLQAKNFYFDLETLFGHDLEAAQTFVDGNFATIYLAPHNYHRVHMPLIGRLTKTIYVPGKLFAVNRMTSEIIPKLYSRNERFIALFDTAAGKVAVIMVGALIVGSIKMNWMKKPIRNKSVVTNIFSTSPQYNKGDELGYFKLGSTVILLFEKNKINLSSSSLINTHILIGQPLANIK
ncbi:MAG: hypothetical protein ACD_46C00207G0002 [uncultured bacterium]|nr:MAG: hypothetical protein ACD_46C00207G0002 [uncultured bacterium]